MLFVCYPKCSTCQKAKTWLQERSVAFDERDIKQDNPTEQELRAWHEKSGLPLKRFFNTSGLQYKALGLKDKLPAMTEDEQYALLLKRKHSRFRQNNTPLLVLFRVNERITVITFLAFLLELLAYNKAVSVPVNISPAQAENFGLAHTGENIEEEQIIEFILADQIEKLIQLGRGDRFGAGLRYTRQRAEVSNIAL